MTDRAPNPRCPDCKGTGIISRPYMVGMSGGDLHTMTACDCHMRAGDWIKREDTSHD